MNMERAQVLIIILPTVPPMSQMGKTETFNISELGVVPNLKSQYK